MRLRLLSPKNHEEPKQIRKNTNHTTKMSKMRQPRSRRMRSSLFLLVAALLWCNSHAQQYDQGGYGQEEYSQDNLYHDYAARQEQKDAGVGKG